MTRILFSAFLCLSYIVSAQEGSLVAYRTHITLTSEKLITEKSYLIQVNRKDGEWLGEITIPQSGMSKVQILEAYIKDGNGKIVRKLSKKEITHASDLESSLLYSDSYIYSFSLKHNSYPYQIYYRYRTTYREFFFVTKWTPIAYYSIPTIHAELVVDIEGGQEVNISASSEFDYSHSSMDGVDHHVWKMDSAVAVKRNVMSPMFIEMVPKVVINPKKFRFGVEGSLESWQGFGQWKTNLIEGLEDLPSEEIAKIKSLVEGIDDQREIISTIYKHLQENHRYIYVGEDIGGLKPHPASYVTVNRYGDCKALTNYMKTALACVGVNSYYTTLYAGDNPVRVNANTPGHQSNHVILCVPLASDTVWLENTVNYFPSGYLGTFTQGRLALLNDGPNSKLIKTPSLSVADVLQERTVVMNFEDILNPTASMQATLRGKQFESMSYYQKNGSEQNRKDYVLKMIPYRNCSLTGWKPLRPDKLTELKIEATFKPKNMVRRLGNIYALALPNLDLPDFERIEKRVHPVRINYPIATSDSLMISTNHSLTKVMRLPEPVSIESKFGSYTLSCTEAENGAVLIRQLVINRGEYPIGLYPEFYGFLEQMQLAEKKSNILIEY